MVYNFATGTNKMPIEMVSGSQKFRVAVSLALAIGQFASRDSHRIESVIIDEGFGSLDRNSREDMIGEINNLKNMLKRIILVSHQEEFAHAFPNRYQIRLENKASVVQLVE
jgi:DNA repair protein SbcC/Rad50